MSLALYLSRVRSNEVLGGTSSTVMLLLCGSARSRDHLLPRRCRDAKLKLGLRHCLFNRAMPCVGGSTPIFGRAHQKVAIGRAANLEQQLLLIRRVRRRSIWQPPTIWPTQSQRAFSLLEQTHRAA